MKAVVKVRTGWGDEQRFEAEYVNPDEASRAQADALFQAVEYLNGEIMKRVEESPEVVRREGE